VSKKKKQQQAVQRAQQYVSGSKLQKSEVKKLESKGFSSKQIQSVAAGMKVGDKAQSRIDSKHSSTGGSRRRWRWPQKGSDRRHQPQCPGG
jgi:hypothetical protein